MIQPIYNQSCLELLSFILGAQCSADVTLLTPSFGNHLFVNYHFFKDPITNLILSSFYIPKVLKSATKIMEIGLQIKI